VPVLSGAAMIDIKPGKAWTKWQVDLSGNEKKRYLHVIRCYIPDWCQQGDFCGDSRLLPQFDLE